MFDRNKSLLAGVSTPTLQGWLTDAQAALAQLSAGSKVVEVNVGAGDVRRAVTYTQANMGALVAWIKMLQAQLGVIDVPRRGITVNFA